MASRADWAQLASGTATGERRKKRGNRGGRQRESERERERGRAGNSILFEKRYIDFLK